MDAGAVQEGQRRCAGRGWSRGGWARSCRPTAAARACAPTLALQRTLTGQPAPACVGGQWAPRPPRPGRRQPRGRRQPQTTDAPRAAPRRRHTGDGFTNGAELGDPDCKWKKGNVAAKVAGRTISNPGLKSSVPKAE